MCHSQPSCSGVSRWIYKQRDATFLPLVGNKMKIWWQTIENGDESPKPFEFLFPFVLFWRVEERFVACVSPGTAGPHHFLSRLKTRAWNVSEFLLETESSSEERASLGEPVLMELCTRIPGVLVLASVCRPAGKNHQTKPNQNFPLLKSG